jgi:hypothetical protein
MVLVLLLIELWPVSGKLMLPVIGDPVQRNADIGRDDVVEFFETVQKSGTSGPFRIFPIEEFQNNRFAGFGIASVGGYHAAKPRLIQDLIDPRRQLQADPAWMRLLNIRYIVTRQQLPDMPTFKLVHQGSANVYENLSVLPRATLVGQYRVVKPDTAIFDSVRVNDSAQITFLDRDPGLQLGPVEGGAAVVSSYRLNDVVVDVDTPGPALLRLADAWYPDWKVRVDGQPAELLRADYLLRAVPVPAGKHRVEFQFESRSVRTGLAVSIVSLLIVTGLLVAGWWLDRRRRVASHPAPAPAPATAAAV